MSSKPELGIKSLPKYIGKLSYDIVKHHRNEHNGTNPDFNFKLHKIHQTSFGTQIMEALLIEHTAS